LEIAFHLIVSKHWKLPPHFFQPLESKQTIPCKVWFPEAGEPFEVNKSGKRGGKIIQGKIRGKGME
jgi:hypothetical protein